MIFYSISINIFFLNNLFDLPWFKVFIKVLSSGIVGIGEIDPNGVSVQVVVGSGVVSIEVDPLDPVPEVIELTVSGVTVFELVAVDVIDDELGNEYPNVGFAWDWVNCLKRFNNWSNPWFTLIPPTGATGIAEVIGVIGETGETEITWGCAGGLCWIY